MLVKGPQETQSFSHRMKLFVVLRTDYFDNQRRSCNQQDVWQRIATPLCDVIMGTITSQITSLTIVSSIVLHSGANHRKHQSSASLAIVRGIHRWPVNSPHKWPVTRRMFLTSSCKFNELWRKHICNMHENFAGYFCEIRRMNITTVNIGSTLHLDQLKNNLETRKRKKNAKISRMVGHYCPLLVSNPMTKKSHLLRCHMMNALRVCQVCWILVNKKMCAICLPVLFFIAFFSSELNPVSQLCRHDEHK